MDSFGFREFLTASSKPGPPLSTVSILVADDHEAWRCKIRQIVGSRAEWTVLYEACDGLQAVQKAVEQCPDVVLLDIAMPRLNGIAAAKIIRQNSPNCKVLFVTLNSDVCVRSAALDSGARGYVLKAQAAKELLPAIECALCDGGAASGAA